MGPGICYIRVSRPLMIGLIYKFPLCGQNEHTTDAMITLWSKQLHALDHQIASCFIVALLLKMAEPPPQKKPKRNLQVKR